MYALTMNILVIVESKNKIVSITKYIKELQKDGSLSKEDKYTVDASVGHILELPARWLPKAGETEWEFEKKVISKKGKMKGKGPIVTALKKNVKNSDLVLVATDPDREGEAIADDLVKTLKIEDKYKRVTFSEITKEAILASFNKPGLIDNKMVEAQIARLLLDRVMGYKLSKWLKFKIWNDFSSKSAGRVQSPTLKLVMERELLINGFVPEKYIKVSQDMGNEIFAEIVLKDKNINNKPNLLDPAFLPEVKKSLTGKLTVKDVSIKKVNGNRKIPFKQSAVYRSSGMSAGAARSAMQALYEKGLISYPRTDSTRYSAAFIKTAQAYILGKFGKEYVSYDIKGSASGAQDAHEALRVTDPKKTPGSVGLKKPAEVNMYRLIYNHTLQTLMTPPLRESLSYKLDDAGYTFKMSSSKVLFKGYLAVSGYEVSKELPKLTVGDSINSEKIVYDEDQTKPKSRFNEGSLIAKMEEVGIGRPSTYSSTIDTLKKRDYITVESKAITLTEKGKVIIEVLVLYFGKIINEGYTKLLEDDLSEIAIGNKEYKKLLTSFNDKLHEEMDSSRIKSKENELDKTVEIDITTLDKPAVKNYDAEDFYAKKSVELLSSFDKYATVTNKDIKIDYDKFVKNEYDNFKGKIMMPVQPKVIKTLLEDDGVFKGYTKKGTYVNPTKCSECKTGIKVFRFSVKRGKPNWFEACGNFPKCKHADSIDESLQEKLASAHKELNDKLKNEQE